MRTRFLVGLSDGKTVESVTSPVSVVETERRYNLGITDLFIGTSPRMEALYFLMWRSMYPTANIDDDDEFLEFLTDLDTFTVADEDGNDAGDAG